MHIKVDRERCVGAGQCQLLAPNFFTQDEDTGLVVVLDGAPGDGDMEDVHAAISGCPTSTISVTSEE